MMQNPFKCIVYIYCMSDSGLDKLRFDIVTHVNYAFAIPTKDGHVLPLPRPDHARAVIEKAHAQGAKVCISLGGWSYEDIPLEETFRLGTDTPEKIASLAEEIVCLAEDYGFDGVEVDWEYPRTGDGFGPGYRREIIPTNRRNSMENPVLPGSLFMRITSRIADLLLLSFSALSHCIYPGCHLFLSSRLSEPAAPEKGAAALLE